MKEPTPEQCTSHERVEDIGEDLSFACWYPQMGGYVGKAIINLCSTGCFDAYVWHNGEFPFDSADSNPALVHHCDPDQFIRFGELVKAKQEEFNHGNS